MSGLEVQLDDVAYSVEQLTFGKRLRVGLVNCETITAIWLEYRHVCSVLHHQYMLIDRVRVDCVYQIKDDSPYPKREK